MRLKIREGLRRVRFWGADGRASRWFLGQRKADGESANQVLNANVLWIWSCLSRPMRENPGPLAMLAVMLVFVGVLVFGVLESPYG